MAAGWTVTSANDPRNSRAHVPPESAASGHVALFLPSASTNGPQTPATNRNGETSTRARFHLINRSRTQAAAQGRNRRLRSPFPPTNQEVARSSRAGRTTPHCIRRGVLSPPQDQCGRRFARPPQFESCWAHHSSLHSSRCAQPSSGSVRPSLRSAATVRVVLGAPLLIAFVAVCSALLRISAAVASLGRYSSSRAGRIKLISIERVAAGCLSSTPARRGQVRTRGSLHVVGNDRREFPRQIVDLRLDVTPS